MGQKECVEQMWKFPGAATYENFSFHIALLKQFKHEDELETSRRRVTGMSKRSSASDLPSSVHGSKVFQTMSRRGGKKKGVPSRGLSSISSSGDQLSNSV